MQSSVLLAILVGAGVLALMPALIRRYDTALRGEHELRSSTMRVLQRRKRGSHDVVTEQPAAPVEQVAEAPAPKPAPRMGATPARRVERRPAAGRSLVPLAILAVLLLMAVVFVIGGVVVSPGLWAGTATSLFIMTVYTGRLRRVGRARVRARLARQARRFKARALVEEIMRTAHLDTETVRVVVAWLAEWPHARQRPASVVRRVLAAAGREPYQAADGAWGVRRVRARKPRLTVAPVSAPAARQAAPATVTRMPRTGLRHTMRATPTEVFDNELELPRVVNL